MVAGADAGASATGVVLITGAIVVGETAACTTSGLAGRLPKRRRPSRLLSFFNLPFEGDDGESDTTGSDAVERIVEDLICSSLMLTTYENELERSSSNGMWVPL
jgi:hypothetical protein